MNLFINAAGDKPMYEQVKDGIKEAILSGELKAHQLMPSVRQLAADLNVSMITTKRAYSDLERDGLIYTVAGKGTFVKTEDIGMLQEKHIGEILDRFAEQAAELKKLGVPIERLDSELKKIYGGNKNE
ncbi:MAG: GntR family transcriptional regulator [Oscillospiraceae bacterium]|nr:GntR family transcriptional regulator [Oscillospiraceae bacterium]